jgi:molecular chaperone DnaK
MVYQTEKSLKEHGGDLDAAAKSNIEEALAAAKKELEGQDAAAMKQANERLSQAAHKLAEAMYAKARQSTQGTAGASSQNGAPPGAEAKSGGKDDAVDADFEEVKG